MKFPRLPFRKNKRASPGASATSRAAAVPPSGSSTARGTRGNKRSSRFSSRTFVILRFFHFFIAICLLGAAIRLLLYKDYTFQKRDVVDRINDSFITKNKFAYYFMIGVSSFTILFSIVSFLRYGSGGLSPVTVIFTEIFFILLWLAAVIVWGIAVNKFFGFRWNTKDINLSNRDDYYYYYLRGAHTGIMGLAIIQLLLFIPTLFIGFKHRRARYNYRTLPDQHIEGGHGVLRPVGASFELPRETPSSSAAAPPYMKTENRTHSQGEENGLNSSYYDPTVRDDSFAAPPSYMQGDAPTPSDRKSYQ